MALRDAAGLERVIVDTYQAVSGSGDKAMAELAVAGRGPRRRSRDGRQRLPAPIAFNAIREIDVFLENGYSREEWKVITESRKILHLPELRHVLHGRPRAGLHQPLRGGPRRAARSAQPRPGARGLRRRARRDRRRRAGRVPSTRWRPRLPARTRSSSGGSGGTCRSPTAAGSPSGWSATTCARAPPRTPSRSPSWSPPAAGSRPRRAGPGARRDGRGATRSPGGHRRRGPESAPAAGWPRAAPAPFRGRAAPTPRSSSSARARASMRTSRGGRSSAPQAASSPTCSARSAGGATRSSSPTSSSAGRPATATPSPTRWRPAPRTWPGNWPSWTRRSW